MFSHPVVSASRVIDVAFAEFGMHKAVCEYGRRPVAQRCADSHTRMANGTILDCDANPKRDQNGGVRPESVRQGPGLDVELTLPRGKFLELLEVAQVPDSSSLLFWVTSKSTANVPSQDCEQRIRRVMYLDHRLSATHRAAQLSFTSTM